MARNNWHLPWEQYVETLKPHERPMMPGSPATPDHSWPMRIQYALTGLLVAMVGSLGNAAVTANIQNLQGSLGITITEAAWLPVVFVMTNACMNLILFKFRQQYGLRLFTQICLTAFVVTYTTRSGRKREITLEAPNPATARRMLRQRGILGNTLVRRQDAVAPQAAASSISAG